MALGFPNLITDKGKKFCGYKLIGFENRVSSQWKSFIGKFNNSDFRFFTIRGSLPDLIFSGHV